MAAESDTASQQTKAAILGYIKPLEKCSQSGYKGELSHSQSKVSSNTRRAIEEWVKGQGNRVLHLKSTDSVNNTFSNDIACRLLHGNKAVICLLDRDDYASVERKKSSKPLRILQSTLSWQLANLLPESFPDPEEKLSKKVFENLASNDGPASTTKAAELIQNLLELAPKELFCVFNGLEHMEATNKAKDRLSDLLSPLLTPGRGRTCKLLWAGAWRPEKGGFLEKAKGCKETLKYEFCDDDRLSREATISHILF